MNPHLKDGDIIASWYRAQDAKLAAAACPQILRDPRFCKTDDHDSENQKFTARSNQVLADLAASMEITNLMISIIDDPDASSRATKRADLQNKLSRRESETTQTAANAQDANTDTRATAAALELEALRKKVNAFPAPAKPEDIDPKG